MPSRPGLPTDFELDAHQEDTATPVEVLDYLDRELVAVAKEPPPTRTRQRPRTPVNNDEPPRLVTPAKTTHVKARRRRKELSLNADTQRKVMDVISDIRAQGPQADATPSELLRALIQLAYDVRHRADYSRLNPRGQWGSATAEAFVAELKEVYLKAIGNSFLERYGQDNR